MAWPAIDARSRCLTCVWKHTAEESGVCGLLPLPHEHSTRL